LEHPAKKHLKTPKPARRHRFTRRTKLLLLLIAAVAAAAGFLLLLPAIHERFPIPAASSIKAEQTYLTLDSGDKNVLDSITVSHEDGETYTLLYRDEKLYLQREGEPNELVSDSYTDDIVTAATVLEIEDTVAKDAGEVNDYLADMGLEPPKITVKVGYANGREVELQIGNKVPETGYYYYRWSGDDGVYMCDAATHDAFVYTAQILLPVTQPTLVPALIDRLSIRTQSAGLMECDVATDGSDAYLGTLRKPYVYPMDSDTLTTLMTTLKNFRLGTHMDTVTNDNQSQYGFDDPAAVVEIHQQKGTTMQTDADGAVHSVQVDAQAIRLTFGDADGEFFRYCEYAGECYRVSSFLVTSLLDANADAYVSNAPADMGTANIASVRIQLGSGTVDVEAAYTQQVLDNNKVETDDSGNPVYDITVTKNGQPMTTEAFNALVERLKGMTVSGKLDTQETPSGTPRWQMTLTTTGGQTRTLAAYPRDTFTDVLAVDGVALQYMNAEALQIALGELYPQ